MNSVTTANKMLASKKRKGFTLVELIVVIVVIAIIAAIAIPRIVSFQDSARKARIQAEHRELVTAVQLYIASNPDTAKTSITLAELVPYMNLNGSTQSDVNALTAQLAKNGEKTAHKIDAGVLTSWYVDSATTNKDDTDVSENKWVYNFN